MSLTPRADLYHALAEILAGSPEWMTAPAREWPLYENVTRAGSASPAARRAILALSAIPAETMVQRQARYAALFGGISGVPRHWLYESAAATGRILGPLTFEVAKLYRTAGLETAWGAELPDHASLELAFLAHLAKQAESDTAHADEWCAVEQQFIRQHGGWLIHLGHALVISGNEVYAPIGALLADWLQENRTPAPFSAGEKPRPSSNGKGEKGESRLPTLPHAEACTLCGFCVQVCPVRALAVRESESETLLLLNATACTGCGKCVRVCEMKALALTQRERGWAEGIVLRRSPRVICPACSKPTVSRAELDYVAAHLDHPAWLEFCLDCRPHFFGG